MAIKKFQDLQVEYPQRYEVTDNAGTENLKTIKFSPGKVYQEGTKETAVIFNNIQKNGLYTVIGTRVIEGNEEIYDVELEGLEEFGIFDINLQLVANSKNTTNSPKLRILNEKYSFVNNNGTISVGDLTTNNIHVVKIDTVKKTAFLIGSDKLDKGTYPGNASDLNDEISKIASTTQLGRIKVGTNLRIDENGFLHGNPDVDISGKMDKYKDVTSIISDYDDIIEDGFYIARGSEQGIKNAPYGDSALVQVWNYGGYIYQNAVSYYKVDLQFTRCFYKGAKNTKWEKIVDTTDIVNNLTTTAPGQVLDARQGPAIVNKINGLAGGYSGTFPLTTAVKEGIYLLPATNKFYVCVENYNGSSLTAPNANFEELSVFQNRNKLENLFKIPKKIISANIILTTIEQSLNLEYEQDNIDHIIIHSNSAGRFPPILVTPSMFKNGWLTQSYGGGSVNPANFRHMAMWISENKLYYTSAKIDSSGVSQNDSSGIILEIY